MTENGDGAAFGIMRTDRGIHVDGFPDAVELVKLTGPAAERIADLALHRIDIEFAIACLNGLNEVQNPQLQEAIWRCALVNTIKCFGGSNARRHDLDPRAIIDGDLNGMIVFEHLKNLRNKHLVHDDNAYSQSLPGAVVNPDGMVPRIAGILDLCFATPTLTEENAGNLAKLCEQALVWVNEERERVAEGIAASLEAMGYGDVIALGPVQMTPPNVDAVGRTRPRIGAPPTP